ncbi:hypothetical protein BKI52_10970 [marine bacterium AO1-C]|nr:hypothetical protein BKI52_10970 [marine bacterium AO1-C]
MEQEQIQQFIDWLQEADLLLIHTGAGMSKDSGVPTYRDAVDGEWGKVTGEREGSIFDIMNPTYMEQNPVYMWQRFSRRIEQFQDLIPHQGYFILMDWIKRFNLDYFCVTSNIDGQHLKAGAATNKVREVHGSIFHMQCTVPCHQGVWAVSDQEKVDHRNPNLGMDALPVCPKCGKMSRPNVYMFRDSTYVPARSKQQKENLEKTLAAHSKVLILEIGSGPHVQTIRSMTRKVIKDKNARLIRINPDYPEVKDRHMGLAGGALAILSEVHREVEKMF